jgi:hypothetical protein
MRTARAGVCPHDVLSEQDGGISPEVTVTASTEAPSRASDGDFVAGAASKSGRRIGASAGAGRMFARGLAKAGMLSGVALAPQKVSPASGEPISSAADARMTQSAASLGADTRAIQVSPTETCTELTKSSTPAATPAGAVAAAVVPVAPLQKSPSVFSDRPRPLGVAALTRPAAAMPPSSAPLAVAAQTRPAAATPPSGSSAPLAPPSTNRAASALSIQRGNGGGGGSRMLASALGRRRRSPPDSEADRR